MSASIKDFAKLHFIVFLWGFTAIIGNEITIMATNVVMYRTALASIVLFLFMYWKKKQLRFDSKALFQFSVTGLIIAAHWFLFFESARVSNVSVCLAGMATTSFWTSLIEPLLNKGRIKAVEVILGLIVIAGLYTIFQFEFDNALGLTLAITSALMASLFSVINARLVRQHSEYGITFYEMLAACIGITLFIPIYKATLNIEGAVYSLPTTRDWGLLIVLAVVCTVYAFSASVELMKRISAYAVNLTVNLEPVYGIIMAVLLYGEKEQMSSGFYYGTLIILAAVFAYPVLNRKRRTT